MMGYIFLIGFPDQVLKKPHWGFLNPEEVAFIIRRVNRDRGDADEEKFNFRKWAASGADWKIWSFAMIVSLLPASTASCANTASSCESDGTLRRTIC